MKKFIFKLSLFVILFLLFDLILGQSFEALYFKVKSGTIFSTVYGIQESREDILIMGASEVSHSFISKQIEDGTGLTCYNLGFDAHNIYYQYAILREALARYTPYIIVVSTNSVVEDERTISSLFPFRKKYSRIKETIYDVAPFEKFKLISNTYAYNSNIINIIQGLVLSEPQTNGYKPIYLQIPENRIDTVEYIIPSSPRTIEYFNRFLNLARSAGCKVVVVNTPKFKYNLIHNHPTEIKELISEYKIAYLDYENDTAFLNHHDLFYDGVHLNNTGAKVFTNRFISDLNNIIFQKK